MEDVTHVYLAGIGNSGPSHWQRMWYETLGGVWLEHDDWDHPDRDAWMGDLQDALRGIEGPRVAIAHSLGCLLVSELTREPGAAALDGAFLVAVPDVGGPHFPAEAHGFSVPDAPLPFPALVVSSQNDPYGSADYAFAVATLWGAEFIDVGGKGHINAVSRLRDWAAGRALLDGFVAKL